MRPNIDRILGARNLKNIRHWVFSQWESLIFKIKAYYRGVTDNHMQCLVFKTFLEEIFVYTFLRSSKFEKKKPALISYICTFF